MSMWRNAQTAARRHPAQPSPEDEPASEVQTAAPQAEPPRTAPEPPVPRHDEANGAGLGARPPRRHLSLTWRILALNVLALVTLVVGLLYLDRYRTSLIDAEIDSLTVQAQIFAEAIGEAAVTTNTGQDYLTANTRPLVRRLAEPANLRARLFAINGDLIADSRALSGPGGMVQIAELPPPPDPNPTIFDRVVDAYEWVLGLFPHSDYPPYRESAPQVATDYPEAVRALRGETGNAVRRGPRSGLILSVAVPVSRYKQVLGAIMLSTDSRDVEESLRSVRIDILNVFAIVLIATVLMSLYLSGTIARPVRRLAAAAEHVRLGHGRKVEIPDFSRRGDEIGDLSTALREMTDALWIRMDAIERFAADVAHEIKNPLSSLRSAVETASRIEDIPQQRKLLAIIADDVKRLDRLISDISDASRLDAELSRAESEPVDIANLLTTLAEIHQATAPENGVRLESRIDDAKDLVVFGIEDRLVQVFRNLISNAISFSPAGGVILLRAWREGPWVNIAVEDQGPGVPEDKLGAIFDRFYTERPKGEKFGTHSGLGLSISKQIVVAHNGRIWAENIHADGQGAGAAVRGARFVVAMRAAPRAKTGA
jgi:two-component system sensor histidine kinase ChvG